MRKRRPLPKAKRRALMVISVTGGFLFIALVVGLLFFFDYLSHKDPILMEEMSASAPSTAFGKGLLLLDSQKATLYKKNGGVSWSVEVEGTQIAAGKHICAIYTDNKMQVLDTSGTTLFVQAFDKKPLSVSCGTSMTAVLFLEEDGSHRIDVYDSGGRLSDQITSRYLPAGQDVLQMGFHEGTLWVLTLEVSATEPISRVMMFDAQNQQTTGAVTIRGQVLYDVFFYDKVFFAIGTNQIVCYNYLGERQDARAVYGWQVAASGASGEQSVMVLAPLIESTTPDAPKTTLKLLVDSNEYTLVLPETRYQSVFITNALVYVLCEDQLVSYTLAGERKSTVTLPTSPTSAGLLSDGRTLFFSDGTQRYSYRVR